MSALSADNEPLSPRAADPESPRHEAAARFFATTSSGDEEVVARDRLRRFDVGISGFWTLAQAGAILLLSPACFVSAMHPSGAIF